MTDYLGMDLPRFVALVRARAWLIAGIVGAAMLFALVASLAQASRYQATADLLFGRSSTADAIIAGGATERADLPEQETATNLALASLDTVAARVKQQLRTSASVDELENAVTVEAEGASDVATVTAEWSTAEQAAAVANAFAAQIVAIRRERAQADIQRAIDALNRTLAAPPEAGAEASPDSTRALRDRIAQLRALKAVETGGVQIVEQAVPPQHRSAPKPLRNALVAGFVALALALFVVALLARFDKRISDEDELAEVTGAPVLARIPRAPGARPLGLTRAGDPHEDPAFLEAFEFLRLNLQLMGPKSGNVVAVTSPTAGNGKTTVVAWLTRSLALSGAEVIAVDLDRRKPDLHNYLIDYDVQTNGVFAAKRDDDSGAPTPEKRPERRVYTAEDIKAGLTELAQCGGNARAAARSLKLAGRDFPESTLRRWKVVHAPLYAEIGATRTQDAQSTAVAESGRHWPPSDELAQLTLHPNVRLVTGGNHSAVPTESLAMDRLPQLFAELRNKADFVIVDTVPVSTVADASAVAAAADGVILVLDVVATSRRDLLVAKKQLAHASADVLGIVLNRATVDYRGYGSEERGEPAADRRPNGDAPPPRD
jgi:Mrp family chromosome partitioning ATPase